ncbi:hypothetical protein JZ751_025697 [Albula glossodonta]|uniref:Uncharacterized protein n=1 Tax=Albula glossodonta TaxID=121402 RepID=A0A8T2NDB7_9TELE|nr:hypothetical protein JZ751_025697 [Albula glossodonta]
MSSKSSPYHTEFPRRHWYVDTFVNVRAASHFMFTIQKSDSNSMVALQMFPHLRCDEEMQKKKKGSV